MKKLSNQRGVAMVVVLLVGAVLTVVASSAAFMTIEEFRSGDDDRRASQALAYAEAGIDRMMQEIKGGSWTWKEMAQSGCGSEALLQIGGDPGLGGDGEIGNGFYTAEVRPAECVSPVPRPSTREAIRLNILSVGEHPTARRVIQQVVELKPKGLPIGVFAYDTIDVGGNVSEKRISLITRGSVLDRDKIAFIGNDPYYTKGDFYGDAVSDPDSPMPAAAHAADSLFCSGGGCPNSTVHTATTNPNCRANRQDNVLGSVRTQSVWDGSEHGHALNNSNATCVGYGGPFPPTTVFTESHPLAQDPQPVFTDDELRALKNSAKSSGLYCEGRYINASSIQYTCEKAGATYNCTGQCLTGSVSSEMVAGLPRNFVTWYELPEEKLNGDDADPTSSAHLVRWNPAITSCSNDETLNRSVVVWIENGSFRLESNSRVTGGLFVLDGNVETAGGAELHGTVIAQNIEMVGNSNFLLDECWVDNMPVPFLKLTPISWTEVDA